MPRANDNRKPVGTELCRTCHNEAEFYQVQSGPFRGYLYRKGCDCKADQDKKLYKQLEWLGRMQRTPHPMAPHPLEGQEPGEPEATPQPKPQEPPAPATQEPQAPQGGSDNPPGKHTGLIGLVLLVGSVTVALIA